MEVAFISNAEEEKLLVSEAYQSKVVAAVVRGDRALPAAAQRERGAAGGGPPADLGRP